MAPEKMAAGRREALIQLLRAGGLGAGAAGIAFWLKNRSRYPEEPPAAVSVKRDFTVPSVIPVTRAISS